MLQVVGLAHAYLFSLSQVQVSGGHECRQPDVSVLAFTTAPMAKVHPSTSRYGKHWVACLVPILLLNA